MNIIFMQIFRHGIDKGQAARTALTISKRLSRRLLIPISCHELLARGLAAVWACGLIRMLACQPGKSIPDVFMGTNVKESDFRWHELREPFPHCLDDPASQSAVELYGCFDRSFQ